MHDLNFLQYADRKRLNDEANNVKSGTLADPLPLLPKKFFAVAKIISDGQDIVIYLPKEFVGQCVALEVNHCNAIYIVGGTGFPIKDVYYTDEDNNIYGAQVRLPSDIMPLPVKRTGAMRHTCTRNARKVLFGDMLNKLTSGYSQRKADIRSYPAATSPVIPSAAATIMVPEPIAAQVKADMISTPTKDEREMLRMAQGLINDAIRSKGYTAYLMPDNTIKLTMEV